MGCESSGFCANPFVQLSTVPAGFIRPCCYYERVLRDGKKKNFSVSENSLDEVWNSSELRALRRQIYQGEKVPQCQPCYTEELSGNTSLRQRSLKDWMEREDVIRDIERAAQQDFVMESSPRFLELKPGSLCNLKCRMCNQYDSSLVASELRQLQVKYPELIHAGEPRLLDDQVFEVDFNLEKMPDWEKVDGFWSDVEKLLPTLEVLSFAGGEPTLLKQVERILSFCVEAGHAQHIKVFLSSNFTRVSERLLELSRHFQLFEFIASIDGMGAIQEYIRHPSKWSVVSENFVRVKQLIREGQTKLLINLTVQMNNILHFTDVLDWIDALDMSAPHFYQHPYALNILHLPRYLNFNILPEPGRIIARQRIDEYVARSKTLKRFPEMEERFSLIKDLLAARAPEDAEDVLQQFLQYTRILDGHRKESLINVDPLLFQICHGEMK